MCVDGPGGRSRSRTAATWTRSCGPRASRSAGTRPRLDRLVVPQPGEGVGHPQRAVEGAVHARVEERGEVQLSDARHQGDRSLTGPGDAEAGVARLHERLPLPVSQHCHVGVGPRPCRSLDVAPIEHHVHGLDPLAPGGARPGPRGATAGGAQNEDRRDQKGTDSPRAPRTCHEAATRRRSPAVTAPSAGVLVDHALSQEQWGCQRTMVMVTRVCVSIRLDQPGPTGWWWWWRGGDDWWDAAPVSP